MAEFKLEFSVSRSEARGPSLGAYIVKYKSVREVLNVQKGTNKLLSPVKANMNDSVCV